MRALRGEGGIIEGGLTTTAIQNGLDANDVGGGTGGHDAVQDRDLGIFAETGDVGAEKIELSASTRKR